MTDKNKYAGHYAGYGIVSEGNLPVDVRDELCNDGPGNDAGRIIDPEYRPKFKAWLKAEQMPIQPYIVWWSW